MLLSLFGSDPWINLKDYTPFVLITFGLGCLLWAVVYIIVIRDIIKTKRIDIPNAAICCNFAWEIYWGLFYHTNMGRLFEWAYFIWFFLDMFIVYSMFKYGASQAITSGTKKLHIPAMAIILTMWLVIFHFEIPQYDDPVGALSGWIVNVYMSVLFCYLKIRTPEFGLNRLVAVGKFLGTGFCTSVVFVNFYANKTLVALCFIFAAFDLIYIYLVFTGPKAADVHPANAS